MQDITYSSDRLVHILDHNLPAITVTSGHFEIFITVNISEFERQLDSIAIATLYNLLNCHSVGLWCEQTAG
jgi:hypothetical protein